MILARRTAILIYAALGTVIAWMIVGTTLAIWMWYAPAPPGSFKLDAHNEIMICSQVLNWALPLGLILTFLAVFASFRSRFSVPVAVCLGMVFLLSATASLSWWHHMDVAHGTKINLSKNHIWWAWQRSTEIIE